MDDFIEVSAITSEHRERNMQKQLVACTANAILSKTKFLSYMLPQLISAP
jgi:hypothetical protein